MTTQRPSPPPRPDAAALAPGVAVPQSPRRRWLMGGVASTAAAAGAGWAWWQSLVSGSGPAPSERDRVWSMSFDQPDGGRLEMRPLLGRPLVLNFWATWCPPCIEELPDLDRFVKQWGPRGWQVVGLAVDSPSAVRSFLARQPLSFPIGLAGLDGATLSKDLGNGTGGLPFTAMFDARGRLRRQKSGQTRLAELSEWAKDF